MPKYFDKKIVSVIGPPGSGKGTQADLIAEQFSLFHFDTGSFLRKMFADANPDDKEMADELAIWRSGELNSPPFVSKKVIEQTSNLISQKSGVVFSGSPRTIYEAKEEAPFFDNLVGRSNVLIFYVTISKEESIKRNSGRLICEKNKHSIPNLPDFEDIRKGGVCPKDGSKLVKKELDSPDVIASRYDVFFEKTKQVLDVLKGMGYKVIEINGEQSIGGVFEDIRAHLS